MRLTNGASQCAYCSRYFANETSFDAHRRAEAIKMLGQCLTSDEMLENGMQMSDGPKGKRWDGFWRIKAAQKGAA